MTAEKTAKPEGAGIPPLHLIEADMSYPAHLLLRHIGQPNYAAQKYLRTLAANIIAGDY